MRQLCYAIIFILVLASCRDKVICPTFQSTYILDDSVRSTYFSYLWYLDEDERKSHLATNAKIPPPDSLGVTVASAEGSGVDYWDYTAQYKVPNRTTKRTKYGIQKQWPVAPNFVRTQRLKTSPMKNVLTPPGVEKEEDTVREPANTPAGSSALAPLDSTAMVAQPDSLGTSKPTDSTALAANDKKKEWERFKYGFDYKQPMQPDQEYYFKKYGWLLQNQPSPEEPVDSTALAQSGQAADSTAKKGGLKNLFGKNKDKSPKEKKKKSKEEESPEGPDLNEEATLPEEGSDASENPDGGNR